MLSRIKTGDRMPLLSETAISTANGVRSGQHPLLAFDRKRNAASDDGMSYDEWEALGVERRLLSI